MAKNLPLDGEKIRFILSAGRTGTVFLASGLQELYPRHNVVHEPRTSRRMFMAYNAEQTGLLPAGTALRIFLKDRRRVLAALPEQSVRIELNPFLHPLAPCLHEAVVPLRIVHIVRDAKDWIQSLINFGAAGWRRHLIERTPFARTIHPAARPQWRNLDTVSRFAWRWRLANEQILSAADNAEYYGLVRYEDLFATEREHARDAVESLIEVLPPQEVAAVGDLPWTARANRSHADKLGGWQSWPETTKERVDDICGDLLRKFGYSDD